MGGSLDWGVKGEEGSESREMAVKPSLKGEEGPKSQALFIFFFFFFFYIMYSLLEYKN